MTTLTPNHSSDVQTLSAHARHADEPAYFGIRLTSWVKIGTIAALFCLLFWPNLQRLWNKTNPFTGEDNWKHAIFVPLLGLYYLYVNRDQLAASQTKPTWSGLPFMVGGILVFGYAIWPLQNDWFKDLGMVVTLFGVVTLLCGWQVMKTAWFPIAFLVCALPWPGLFYSMLAGPLQEMAARVAVRVMNFVGVHSAQSGTKIFVEGKNHVFHTLNVAEACAGLRSLMTFISIAAAVAFLSIRPLWQKIIMVFSAIPIAIFCNMMRVTMQGVLARYASSQWAEGAAHGFVGLVMMIPAFFLILLVGWILQNIMIEEVDDKQALREANAARSRGSKNANPPVAGVKPIAKAIPVGESAPRVTVQAITAARAATVRQPPAKTGTAVPTASVAAPIPSAAAPVAPRKPLAPAANTASAAPPAPRKAVPPSPGTVAPNPAARPTAAKPPVAVPRTVAPAGPTKPVLAPKTTPPASGAAATSGPAAVQRPRAASIPPATRPANPGKETKP